MRSDKHEEEAVFFTRDVCQEVGPLDLSCEYSMDYDYWLRIGKRYSPFYINKFLANFRWQRVSKNSESYNKAAYETYLTARRHAVPYFQNKYTLMKHYLHYLILILILEFRVYAL